MNACKFSACGLVKFGTFLGLPGITPSLPILIAVGTRSDIKWTWKVTNCPIDIRTVLECFCEALSRQRDSFAEGDIPGPYGRDISESWKPRKQKNSVQNLLSWILIHESFVFPLDNGVDYGFYFFCLRYISEDNCLNIFVGEKDFSLSGGVAILKSHCWEHRRLPRFYSLREVRFFIEID